MMHSKNLSRVCSLKYRLPTLLYIAYSVYSVEQISQYVCPPLKMPYPGRDMLYPTVSHSTPCYTLLCYALHYNTVSQCVLLYPLFYYYLLYCIPLFPTLLPAVLSSAMLNSKTLYPTVS